ncbi:MAG: phosphoadenylyl-sulfate reductase [Rhodospirillales bacterium]|nr:phosphoadenylyl-sulfate reductase [Rhodospirillales bacterium]
MHLSPIRLADADPIPPALARAAKAGNVMGMLEIAITEAFRGRICAVSSFGAESAVLLAMIAEIDRATPVLFLDTGRHFPETLAYRARLIARLGLADARVIAPSQDAVMDSDPGGDLWFFDPDACCALRKITPLGPALAPFAAWISGRKRFQGGARAALELIEVADGRVKLNPLAGYDAAALAAEFHRRGLPAHPLRAQGFPSIGCAPCTMPADPADPRAGRWAGRRKTECGIHARPPG